MTTRSRAGHQGAGRGVVIDGRAPTCNARGSYIRRCPPAFTLRLAPGIPRRQDPGQRPLFRSCVRRARWQRPPGLSVAEVGPEPETLPDDQLYAPRALPDMATILVIVSAFVGIARVDVRRRPSGLRRLASASPMRQLEAAGRIARDPCAPSRSSVRLRPPIFGRAFWWRAQCKHGRRAVPSPVHGFRGQSGGDVPSRERQHRLEGTSSVLSLGHGLSRRHARPAGESGAPTPELVGRAELEPSKGDRHKCSGFTARTGPKRSVVFLRTQAGIGGTPRRSGRE